MEQVKLEALKRAFARWRASKRRPAEPVPEKLWAKAVEVAQEQGVTRTARLLRLNHSSLKRRIEHAEPAQDFVEVPLSLGSRESVVEVEDASGVRLRLTLPGAKADEAAAAARELWSARP